MYGNKILGRVDKFGRSNTYNPFANNQDLRTLSEQIFYIPNRNAFADAPIICVSTGLITNAISFLGGDFTAKIIDIDGSVLVEKLTPKITDIGKLIYPQINEINWFDVIGMQGDYWLHEQWAGKILVINGKFETTAITANEINKFTGIISAWAGNLNGIPEDTMPCFGQEVSRYYYANLFDKIGTYWGNGDGANTFNLPDGRDGVLKGISGREIPADMPPKVLTDPDVASRFNDKGGNVENEVGSYQRFATKTGNIHLSGRVNNLGEESISSSGVFTHQSPGSTSKLGTTYGGRSNIFFNADIDLSTGQSTRDNNIGVHFIIFI